MQEHIIKNKNKVIWSWEGVIDLVNYIVRSIDANRYNSIYGIPRSGLIFAVLLSHRLNLPIVDGKGINDKTLIVDDICNSGDTFIEIASSYQNCDTASLHIRYNSKFKPTYYAMEVLNDCHQIYPWELDKQ